MIYISISRYYEPSVLSDLDEFQTKRLVPLRANRSESVPAMDIWITYTSRKKGNENMKVKQNDEEYNKYVEAVTPKHNTFINCLNAFWVGGLICIIGQGIMDLFMNYWGYSKDDAASWTSIILVLISVILTSFNLYKKIAKFAGAGALVPITGFANSVASPTIEYQKEGEVFGKGVKIFTIAGPVILFGIFTSWVAGLIYYFLRLAEFI